MTPHISWNITEHFHAGTWVIVLILAVLVDSVITWEVLLQMIPMVTFAPTPALPWIQDVTPRTDYRDEFPPQLSLVRDLGRFRSQSRRNRSSYAAPPLKPQQSGLRRRDCIYGKFLQLYNQISRTDGKYRLAIYMYAYPNQIWSREKDNLFRQNFHNLFSYKTSTIEFIEFISIATWHRTTKEGVI